MHNVCWHCAKLCPATTGYCFSCLLFKSSDDIDKNPLPRKMYITACLVYTQTRFAGFLCCRLFESPVIPPISNKDFFARVQEGLLKSVGRVTQIVQRKDAAPELPLPPDAPKPAEYTLITHKLTDKFASRLLEYLQLAKGLLSSTVMQLQIDVTRGFSGDLFTFTYRSPSNPASTRLPFSREAGSAFEGFMACRTHFFVDQDNDEDKKLGLGHGQVEVPRGFLFGVPLSEASFEAATVCALLNGLLYGFKSNMGDIQQMRIQQQLDDAEPLGVPPRATRTISAPAPPSSSSRSSARSLRATHGAVPWSSASSSAWAACSRSYWATRPATIWRATPRPSSLIFIEHCVAEWAACCVRKKVPVTCTPIPSARVCKTTPRHMP